MHTGNVLVPVRERFRRIPSTVLGQPTIFRATEQISLIRGARPAWNTYARLMQQPVPRDTTRGDRRGGLRCEPTPAPSPVSHTFFLSSLLRSFNSRFSWSRRHCRRIEREPENACKWLDQPDIVLVRIDSAKGFTGVTSLERARYRFRHTVFHYFSGNRRESCYFDGFVASLSRYLAGRYSSVDFLEFYFLSRRKSRFFLISDRTDNGAGFQKLRNRSIVGNNYSANVRLSHIFVT